MWDCEVIKPYLVDRDPGDESDIREKLAPELKKGERLVNGKVMYSAGWIDDEGTVIPFNASEELGGF